MSIPFLIVLTFGVIEYGWAFVKSGQVVNAARNGARIGVRADAVTADVIAEVDARMNEAGLGGSGYTVTVTPGDVTAALLGDTVTVEVTVPYANVELTGFPLPLPDNLRAEVSMAKEGT